MSYGMHVSALPIQGLTVPYAVMADWSGILLDNDSAVVWRCDHRHYYMSTAEDCATYEKARRQRGS